MALSVLLPVLQDLFDSISAGDYPEWKLMIQTMEVADEDKFDFDPLDDTKTWPEDLFPLQPVGRMVLNKNPDNFFNENEQVAYCPALIVPGEYSCYTAVMNHSLWFLALKKKKKPIKLVVSVTCSIISTTVLCNLSSVFTLMFVSCLV